MCGQGVSACPRTRRRGRPPRPTPSLKLAPRAGFEPATTRLTVEGSTAELPRNGARRRSAPRAGAIADGTGSRHPVARTSGATGRGAITHSCVGVLSRPAVAIRRRPPAPADPRRFESMIHASVYRGDWVALTPSRTGVRLTLGGSAGVTVGWLEGVEINVLCAVLGVGFAWPALNLPGRPLRRPTSAPDRAAAGAAGGAAPPARATRRSGRTARRRRDSRSRAGSAA